MYDGTPALHDSGRPGYFCGEIERSRLFISENNMIKLHFFADSYDARFQFVVYTRQEQQQQLVERYGHHPPLYPHRRGQSITPGSVANTHTHTHTHTIHSIATLPSDARFVSSFLIASSYCVSYPLLLLPLYVPDADASAEGWGCFPGIFPGISKSLDK